MPALLDIAATLRDSSRPGHLLGPLRSCQHRKGIFKFIGSFIMMMAYYLWERMKYLYIAMDIEYYGYFKTSDYQFLAQGFGSLWSLFKPSLFPLSLLLTIHSERVPQQELHSFEEYELIITLGPLSFGNNPK